MTWIGARNALGVMQAGPALAADGPLWGDTRQCVVSPRCGITSRHRALRSEKTMEHTDVWSFEAQTIGGQRVKLSRYQGKVLLIVNTASQCGFTPQFDGLQALWQAYQEQGLVVLGFPSNQFGSQDPGNNDEIASFCQLNYGVSFPMMAKIEVNGRTAHPLYQWLTREAPGLLGSQAIKWNFTKFLVGKDGQVIERFEPAVKPEDPALVAAVEKALGGG
jgi:glutathione peroxidase